MSSNYNFLNSKFRKLSEPVSYKLLFDAYRPQQPKVSVIIITYNHSKYISSCLEGVLNQITNFSIECLVGDDFSNDGTTSIISNFEEQNKNLIFHIRRNTNLGKLTGNGRINLLHSLSLARGNYIAICDGDDYWSDPHKLQKQVDYLEANPDCSICTHWVDQKIEEENSIVIDSPTYNGYFETGFFDRKSVFQNDRVITFHTSSFVFRRSYVPLILKMPTSINSGDWWIHLSCLTQGNGFCIKEKMSSYRVHHKGVCTATKTYFRFLSSLHFLLRLAWSFPMQYGKVALKKFLSSLNKISLSDFVSVDPINYQKSNNELKSKDPVFYSVIYFILTTKIFGETLQNKYSKFRIFIGKMI